MLLCSLACPNWSNVILPFANCSTGWPRAQARQFGVCGIGAWFDVPRLEAFAAVEWQSLSVFRCIMDREGSAPGGLASVRALFPSGLAGFRACGCFHLIAISELDLEL